MNGLPAMASTHGEFFTDSREHIIENYRCFRLFTYYYHCETLISPSSLKCSSHEIILEFASEGVVIISLVATRFMTNPRWLGDR
jgi:hypothetical protein